MQSLRHSLLFVNRVFPPDRGASGRCLADLAAQAAAAGWRVTVLADGRDPTEAPSGVTVIRTGGGTDTTPGSTGYFGALVRLLRRGLTLPRPDVVVSMTDPPFLGMVGLLLAARHGAASLHWCHDLYPDLFPVIGVDIAGPIQRSLEWIAGAALRRHDGVVAIGRCMAAKFAAGGVTPHRLRVVPNWPDPRVRPVAHGENAFRRALGLDGRFTVAYSGNFGLAHPLGAVFDAAALLPEVVFLLVGEGRGHAAAVREAEVRRLANVRLLPFQPADRLAESLSSADLHVATMDERAAGLLVPCKVAGALATGRPCILLGPGGSEAARLITEHGCGTVLPPADGAALAEAIAALVADPALLRLQGARALAAATDLSLPVAATAFLDFAGRLSGVRACPTPVPLAVRGAPHG